MNIYDYLNCMKESRPEHIVFSYYSDGEKKDVSVRQWGEDVAAFASYLTSFYEGKRGNNIGVAGRSCYEWYVAVFGIIISGNIAVSLNMDLAEEDLLYQLRTAEVRDIYWAQEEEAASMFAAAGINVHGLSDAVCNAVIENRAEVMLKDGAPDQDATCLILFSSGTSGISKGVMLSQKNLLAALGDLRGKIDRGKAMIMLPLYHVGGIYFSLSFLQYPITLCICESPKYLVRDMKRFHPAIMAMVPAQLEFIAAKCGRDRELYRAAKEDLNYIICVGAVLDIEYEKYFSAWNIQVLNLYGLTETAGALTELFPHKAGTIGRLSPANKMKLIEGELTVKGDSVMSGYYGNSEETEKVLRDGWLFTGDLVKVDSDGFLYLTGRKKNVIILSNGENVSPEGLEIKLYRIKLIQEVIVTGENGILEAEIYLGDGNSLEEQREVEKQIEKMNRELPRYQQIRKIVFRDLPFPKTGNGKIRRLS